MSHTQPVTQFRLVRSNGDIHSYSTSERRDAAAHRYATEDDAQVTAEAWDESLGTWGFEGIVHPRPDHESQQYAIVEHDAAHVRVYWHQPEDGSAGHLAVDIDSQDAAPNVAVHVNGRAVVRPGTRRP